MRRRAWVAVLAVALRCGRILAADVDEAKAPPARTVIIEFVVGKDGRPTQIKVIATSDRQLADSVIAAVSKWRLNKKYIGKKLRQPIKFLDETTRSPSSLLPPSP